MSDNEYLTVHEAAAVAKLTALHLRKLLRDGLIRGTRPGGRGSWRIPARELRRYLEDPEPAGARA